MNDTTESIEKSLEVGKAVIFHAEPQRANGARFKTFIRGWQKGSYILLEVAALQTKLPRLREAQECVLRFLSRGNACGFSSTLMDVGPGAYNSYIRVAWPHDVTIVRVRQHERVEAHVPCSIARASGAEGRGEIQDLSAGGCRLVTGHAIAKGEQVRLSFRLSDGTVVDGLRAIVRSASHLGAEHALGCQFEYDDESLSQDIGFYVLSTVERLRGELPSTPRVLILDKDADAAAGLRQALEEVGYDVVVATDVVDGLFLLRMTVPGVLLVRSGLVPLNGLQVCQLVR
ncbi:MAG: PilZ domain-containing protein, partial [Candidatus Hydrogenedentes bacterium]|nr:PilZ domain-containing protein [Candidatus Hydrogenedentota bacterium]